MSTRRQLFRLALLIAPLTACGGDDSTAPRSRTLSRADAESFFQAFAPHMQQVQRGVPSMSGSASSSAGTVSCPGGGSVRASLGGGSGSSTVVTIVHAGCRVEGADGRRWTVDGDPDLRITIGTLTLPAAPGGEAVITLGIAGALRVDDGSTSGRCAMDANVEIRASLTPPARSSGHYTGKVCGQVVDETFTATP